MSTFSPPFDVFAAFTRKKRGKALLQFSPEKRSILSEDKGDSQNFGQLNFETSICALTEILIKSLAHNLFLQLHLYAQNMFFVSDEKVLKILLLLLLLFYQIEVLASTSKLSHRYVFSRKK